MRAVTLKAIGRVQGWASVGPLKLPLTNAA
ncbi:Uncharacterised protein [Lactiplantibacillus plantarum subsp. plantarum]|nr:Uncharacterised protein [Lactiplantibacillus plantarum subsp. plantarum]